MPVSQLVKAADFPVVGDSCQARSTRFQNTRSINLLPENNESDTPAKEGKVAYLLSVPGKAEIQRLLNTTDPIRGMWVPSNNTASFYVVVRDTVYKFLANYTFQALTGSLLTTSGHVSISDNGIELCLVDGQYGYYSTLSGTTLTQITDSHFYPSSSVAFINGWLVFNRVGTVQFFWSKLYSASLFPDNNTAGKSGYPDNVVGIAVNNQQIYLFGETTTEVWQPVAGSAITPFQSVPGKLMQVGCASSASIQRVNTTLVWVGNVTGGSGIVYAMQNDIPTRISTHAIETSLTKVLFNLGNCQAWSYEQDGHFFYCLLVAGLDKTWCYDFATGRWHERVSNIRGVFQQDRANSHIYFRGKHIVGSQYDPVIYGLDFENFTDGPDPLVRSRWTSHSSANLNRVIYNELEVDFSFGVGLNNDNPEGDPPSYGSTPKAVLYISDDGGKTWGDGLEESLGEIGDYTARARWYNLGYGYDTMFRIEVSDPVNCQIMSARLYIEVCDA